jgi:hypothetical protein
LKSGESSQEGEAPMNRIDEDESAKDLEQDVAAAIQDIPREIEARRQQTTLADLHDMLSHIELLVRGIETNVDESENGHLLRVIESNTKVMVTYTKLIFNVLVIGLTVAFFSSFLLWRYLIQ